MNRILQLLVICCTVALLAGCEEPKPLSLEEIQEIKNQVNQSGKITHNQAVVLSRVTYLMLNGLNSLTESQAKVLCKGLSSCLF